MRKTGIYLQGFALIVVLLCCAPYGLLVLLVMAIRYPKDALGYFVSGLQRLSQQFTHLGEQLNRKPE